VIVTRSSHEPEESYLQVVAPSPQKSEQNTIPAKTAGSKQPGFLGKIGAMLGLMQASKFTGTEKEEDDDGRVGSASTNKSRQSYNLQAQQSDRPPVASR